MSPTDCTSWAVIGWDWPLTLLVLTGLAFCFVLGWHLGAARAERRLTGRGS